MDLHESVELAQLMQSVETQKSQVFPNAATTTNAMEVKTKSSKRSVYVGFYKAQSRQITTTTRKEPLTLNTSRISTMEKIDHRFETKKQFLENQIKLFNEDLDRPLKEDITGCANDEFELKSSIYIKQFSVRKIQLGNNGNLWINAATNFSDELQKLVQESNLRAFAINSDKMVVVSLQSVQSLQSLMECESDSENECVTDHDDYFNDKISRFKLEADPEDWEFFEMDNEFATFSLFISSQYYSVTASVEKCLNWWLSYEKPLPFEEILLGKNFETRIPNYLKNVNIDEYIDSDGSIKETFVKDKLANSSEYIQKLFDKSQQYADTKPIFKVKKIFDESQKTAVKDALSANLVLIQGPPGTGKSHVAVRIIDVLFKIMKSKVANAMSEIPLARIQNEEELVSQEMKNISHHYSKPILILAQRNSSLDFLVEKCIVEFGLVPYQLVRFGERSTSPIVAPFKFSNIIKSAVRHSSQFSNIKWNFNRQLDEFNRKDDLDETIKFMDSEFEIFRQQQLEFFRTKLQGAKILAMTTSGAAINHDLLKMLGIKIVLVEEAAEIMMPNLIASLLPSCEHLILIGDHLQLRPRPASHSMIAQFNMNLSLFEVLVKRNFKCSMLKTSHRLPPFMTKVLNKVFYSNQLEVTISEDINITSSTDRQAAKLDNEGMYFNFYLYII
jgi:hypothetical protein